MQRTHGPGAREMNKPVIAALMSSISARSAYVMHLRVGVVGCRRSRELVAFSLDSDSTGAASEELQGLGGRQN